MRRNVTKLMMCSLAAIALSLTGCGGGGDSATTPTPASATPTPTGTAVNLTSFKSAFYGKTVGAQYSFTLTGSDSTGKSWSGSYSVAAKGATTLTNSAGQSQDVMQSQVLVSLQQNGSAAPTSTIINYNFRVNDDAFFMSQSGSTQFVMTTAYAPMPNTIKVGDFGTLASLKQFALFATDTINSTWQLKPDVNGASQLIITSDSYKNGTGTDTEIDTFTLDANGEPTKITIRVIDRYLSTVLTDLTLSGLRN